MISILHILFLCLAALFFVEGMKLLWRVRGMQRLPALPDLKTAPPSPVPKISVVIAARDEQDRISNTLEHLFAQQGVGLEVIVVNDRSSDRTPEILEEWAKREPRLKVIHVRELPAGWLGKCHACHLAAKEAISPWILFTDADCWLSPDVLLRASLVAGNQKADHVTLTPGVRPETGPAQAWHLAFLLSLSNWFEAANQDKSRLHIGIGAFNFVRREAYEKCGGYEALRLTVIDDVRLGRLLRKAGFRTRAFLGGCDVECHWGVTAFSMVRIMEKNYFAALDYQTAAAIAVVVMGLAIWPLALLGWVTASWQGVCATLALCSWCLPARILSRKLGWGWAGPLLVPIIFPLICYAMANSAWATLRRGGVRWRDTFYPLEQLRAHTVRLR